MGEIVIGHIEGDRYHIRIGDHEVTVDQPLEQGGTDEGPTPTELFVASLASCAAFFAGRFLRRHLGRDQQFGVDCRYHMSYDAPSRVSSVHLDLVLPPDLPEAVRDGALRAAERCTVHNSIERRPTIRITAGERAAAIPG